MVHYIKQHKGMSILIATIIIGLSGFFVAQKILANTQLPISYTDGVNNIINGLGNSSIDKKGLLTTYCTTLQNNKIGFQGQGGGGDINRIYKPGYSIFAIVLCKPLGINLADKETDAYIQKEFDKNRYALGGIPNACNPEYSMTNCDLSVLLRKIFTNTMNDHSTLALAGRALVSKKSKDPVKDFSQRYFEGLSSSKSGFTICGGSSDFSYIGNKSSANVEQAICSHPQTYTYLKDTINSLARQADKMRILNPKIQDEIPKITQTKDCPVSLLNCAYTSQKIVNQTQYQVNARYNELMYYRLLTSWLVQQYTNSNSLFSPLNLAVDNNSTTKQVQMNEIMNLQREVGVSKNAIAIMEKTISNFQAALPLHVGLLAYYEDIVALRKSLVKVYTPINQLYYKLRNVQQKQ